MNRRQVLKVVVEEEKQRKHSGGRILGSKCREIKEGVEKRFRKYSTASFPLNTLSVVVVVSKS